MTARTQLSELTSLQRGLLIGIVASSIISLIPAANPAAGVVTLMAAGLAWGLVPGFWRTVLIGAIAGVVSGVLILGSGFRLAMRVVAIIDPFRAPDFTLEGTAFILIGIGGIFGGTLGVLANLGRRGLGLSSVLASSIIPATGAMTLLLVSEEQRMELFELGAGAWLNIPMFGLVAVLYGAGTGALTGRLENWVAKRSSAKGIEMPALTNKVERTPQ